MQDRHDDGGTLQQQIERGDYRLPTFEHPDAFTDNPCFQLWREINAQYPDAKYILTVRDEGRWIESCANFQRNRRIRPLRAFLGRPDGAGPGGRPSSHFAG